MIISFFLPLRLNGSNTEILRQWFESLINSCNELKNIEVIVKLDDDDISLEEIINIFSEYQKHCVIKYHISPRGAGYKDLSKHYIDLLSLLDQDYAMIVAGSVDMRIKTKGIDSALLNATTTYKDGIFVSHLIRINPFVAEVNNINLAAQVVDPFPVWSRRWIEIVGHFGYNALNDGYTSMIEYYLATEWGIDRRVDLTANSFLKEINGYGPESQHWQTKRREAMESHLSERNIIFAKQAAKNIALNIINPLQQNVYINELIKSVLDTYDKVVVSEQAKRDQRRIRRRRNMGIKFASIALILCVVIYITV
jgi:hypothetical protein